MLAPLLTMRWQVILFVLLGSLMIPSEARADANDVIPESTRPMWFAIGVGPTFYGLNLGGRGRAGRFRRGGDFRGRGKLIFDFGYHFSGDGEGPAIGATIEQSIDRDFYIFNPGFKFWYDIHITDYGIYITPQAKAGYAVGGVCAGCTAVHAFNIALGVEGRVVFKDRWLTFLRVVQLDTFLGDFFGETFILNYDLLIGGGVTF